MWTTTNDRKLTLGTNRLRLGKGRREALDKRRKEGLQPASQCRNPGPDKYREVLDDYKRMEGLIVGRS